MATKQKYSNETMYEVLNQAMKNLSDILVTHNTSIKNLTDKTIEIPPIDTTALERCIQSLEYNRKELDKRCNTPIEVDTDLFAKNMDILFENMEIANKHIQYILKEGNENISKTLSEGNHVISDTFAKKKEKKNNFFIYLWSFSIGIILFLGGYGYYFIKNISKYDGLIQRHSYLEAVQKDIDGYYDEFPEEKEKYLNWLSGKKKGGENTPPAKSTPPTKSKKK